MEPSFWLPPQASTLAGAVDWIFNFVTYTSTIIFVLVVGAMGYLIYKYRRREASEVPTPPEESKILELTWIVVPTILVLMVFTWGFKTFIRLQVAPPDAYEIRVKGFQWGWTFLFPEGFQTTNEIYVPVGRPIRFVMDSQDVLHSFFIPAMRIKQDVLPNRYTSVWFEGTQTGVFDIFCTEFCGTSHSAMIGKVHVVDQNTFTAWAETGGVGNLAAMAPAEAGAVLYKKNACNTCHTIDGSPATGPTWKGLYGKTGHPTDKGAVTVDDNYLREAILNPGAKVVNGYANVMPSNYSTMPGDQVDALIEYIKTLK